MACLVLEIWLPFKNGQISLSGHGLYSPWSWKNSIDWNRLKNFLQVGIDVACMHDRFGGRGFFSFRDLTTFQKQLNFPFGPVHGRGNFKSFRLRSKIHVRHCK